MRPREQSPHSIESFLTQKEKDSEHYCLLTGAGSLRVFVVTAVSILSDLCDEVMGEGALIEGRFASYEAFCTWVRDHGVAEDIKEYWRYYWSMASDLFALYGELPRMSDWEIHEDIILPTMSTHDVSNSDADLLIREQLMETCFALARWVRGNFRF